MTEPADRPEPDRRPACEVCGFPVWAPGRTRHHACEPAPLSQQVCPYIQHTLFDD